MIEFKNTSVPSVVTLNANGVVSPISGVDVSVQAVVLPNQVAMTVPNLLLLPDVAV